MTSGSVDMNLEVMDLLPKIMGNADPVSYSKLLPGVQTSGEYNGGLGYWSGYNPFIYTFTVKAGTYPGNRDNQ